MNSSLPDEPESSSHKRWLKGGRHQGRASLIRNVYLLGALTIVIAQPQAWLAALCLFAGACVLHLGGRSPSRSK